VTTVQVADHCKCLLQLDLDWHIVLILKEFLFDQEKTAGLIIAGWLLLHARDPKRRSAERWTN
jgi:hypothetical protein